MSIDRDSVHTAIVDLGLADRPVCLHSSLRSFGHLEGGADAVVDAFASAGCTLLVPTFSWDTYRLPPPPGMRPERNGIDYETAPGGSVPQSVYTPEANTVDRDMGAVPATVLGRPGRVRGDHPLSSFAAIGPMARSLIAIQKPLDVFAPLASLARRGGAVVLAGVGLNRLTLLHLAEKRAGRTLFRRWADGPDGDPQVVEAGGCSEGFEGLDQHLRHLERRTTVGQSLWRVLDARSALNVATHAIRRDPRVTHCGDDTCRRCADAIAGGPLLTG